MIMLPFTKLTADNLNKSAYHLQVNGVTYCARFSHDDVLPFSAIFLKNAIFASAFFAALDGENKQEYSQVLTKFNSICI